MKRFVSVTLPHWSIERGAIKQMRLGVPSSPSPAKPTQKPAEAPFALVEAGQRGVRLSAVNRAAETAGIMAGQSLADARAIWPSLAVSPAEPFADRQGLRALARWLGRYGIARNAYGLVAESASGHRLRCYGLWVDISGVAHLYGGEAALLSDLEARLRLLGLTARAGLADTLGAAHALAWHGGPSRFAPPGETLPAIARLPVAALRLDQPCVHLLHRLGFKQIGALAQVPRMALERRFRSAKDGQRVLLRLDQALGVQPEPRRPLVEPPILSVQQAYPEPLISSAALENEVAALVIGFCSRLDAAGVGVQAVRLVLYRCDGSAADVAIGLARAVSSPQHVQHLLAEKLGHLDLGFGVDLLSLEAVRVQKLNASQVSLTQACDAGVAGLGAQLIDRLVNRLGAEGVSRIEPRATHWPERCDERVGALTGSMKAANAWAAFGAKSRAASAVARPALLLAPPEPIAVMAEIPEGAPVRFTWRRVAHKVARAAGPERIEAEWWRQLPAHVPARSRDYYALEDEAGARFWVYREGRYAGDEGRDDEGRDNDGSDTRPAWFVHGVFA